MKQLDVGPPDSAIHLNTQIQIALSLDSKNYDSNKFSLNFLKKQKQTNKQTKKEFMYTP